MPLWFFVFHDTPYALMCVVFVLDETASSPFGSAAPDGFAVAIAKNSPVHVHSHLNIIPQCP